MAERLQVSPYENDHSYYWRRNKNKKDPPIGIGRPPKQIHSKVLVGNQSIASGGLETGRSGLFS